MFPIVSKYSFSALKRFCRGKEAHRTEFFILNIWNRAAIEEMMLISSTSNLDDLIQWLISPDLEDKITTINNYYI